MNHNMGNSVNENIIPKLRTPAISLFIGIVYLVLILMTLIVLYNHGTKTKTHGISKNKSVTIFIAIFFVLLVLGILITLIPNLKDLKMLLFQMKPVMYVVVYTIFLIFFLRYLPSDTLNKYPYIITAVTLVFSAGLFYKAITHDYLSDFNLAYEKIKMMVLFFCLITTFIIYYSVNPGDIIQKTFGPTFLLTILLSVFSFLYLLVVFTYTLPKGQKQKGGAFSDIESITITTLVSNILFFLFIFLLIVGIKSYPDGIQGFLSNAGVSAFVIIFSLLICLIYAGIQIVNVYTHINPNSKLLYMSNLSLFRQSLLVLFGIIIVGLAVSWIGINMQKLSDNPTGNTVMTVLINLVLFLMVLTLIHKIMNPSPGKSEKGSPLSELIKNILFFIPCLISNMVKLMIPLFRMIINIIFYIPCLFLNTSANKSSDEAISIFIICFIIGIILLYYLIFYLKRKASLQGGKLYLNDPINTNTYKTISTYEELNGSEYNYHYGISFWLFIDSFPPNTNPSYRHYTSVLNYGNKPNILYNAELNTMIVTVPKPGFELVKKAADEIKSLGKHQKNIEFDEKGINININNIEIDLNEDGLDNKKTMEKIKKEIKKGKNNINLNNIHIDLTTSHDLEEFDKENVIVYKMENILLQKWNNIIINYDGGTLDIFYNNDLVKSVSGIVPYMSYDSLSVGQNEGINGGVCNLIYFKKTLTSVNTYYLYNSVKNQKVPVINYPAYF